MTVAVPCSKQGVQTFEYASRLNLPCTEKDSKIYLLDRTNFLHQKEQFLLLENNSEWLDIADLALQDIYGPRRLHSTCQNIRIAGLRRSQSFHLGKGTRNPRLYHRV